jgi:hypothetical protein
VVCVALIVLCLVHPGCLSVSVFRIDVHKLRRTRESRDNLRVVASEFGEPDALLILTVDVHRQNCNFIFG